MLADKNNYVAFFFQLAMSYPDESKEQKAKHRTL